MAQFTGWVTRKATFMFVPNDDIAEGYLNFKDIPITYEVTGSGTVETHREQFDDWTHSEDVYDVRTDNIEEQPSDWEVYNNSKLEDLIYLYSQLGSFKFFSLGEIIEEPTWELVADDEPIIVEDKVVGYA